MQYQHHPLLILIALLLCAPISLGACQAPPPQDAGSQSASPLSTSAAPLGEYRKIIAEEAKKMIDEQSVTIVDVRTEEEFLSGHVPNAVLVPNETISDKAPEALSDKSAVLLVYCRSGRRSAEASKKLLSLGYQNVYDFGGIIDWPYEVVEGNETAEETVSPSFCCPRS